MNLSYQIWVGFIFVCQKSLKRTFKTWFWVQNHLLYSIWVLVLWIYIGYCGVKKLVWNVCIKALWYTYLFIYLLLTYLSVYLSTRFYWGCNFVNLKEILHPNSITFFQVQIHNNYYFFCIPESFNSKISNQLFRTQIQKVILYSKTGFKCALKIY